MQFRLSVCPINVLEQIQVIRYYIQVLFYVDMSGVVKRGIWKLIVSRLVEQKHFYVASYLNSKFLLDILLIQSIKKI